jgi:hypothetical protein
VLPLAIGKPSGYWTVRRIRRFGYVASIGLPITNLSDIVPRLRRACGTTSDYLSPITNHFSPSHGRASGQAVRLQDLFLVLSQRINLGLFTVATPFRGAGDLKKILGSGFEMIRISQCESPRVFRVYDKEMTN